MNSVTYFRAATDATDSGIANAGASSLARTSAISVFSSFLLFVQIRVVLFIQVSTVACPVCPLDRTQQSIAPALVNWRHMVLMVFALAPDHQAHQRRHTLGVRPRPVTGHAGRRHVRLGEGASGSPD